LCSLGEWGKFDKWIKNHRSSGVYGCWHWICWHKCENAQWAKRRFKKERKTMRFTIIEQPPKNASEYTEASHQDEEQAFVTNLRSLLKDHPSPVCVKNVPLGWAAKVEDFAIQSGYRILMMRSVVNYGELGTAYGTFYYERNSN
jgi:hypothetical protein